MSTRQASKSAQNFNGARETTTAEGIMDQCSAATNAAQEQVQHTIAEYPITTVLAVFGVGLGLGVVIGNSLFGSSNSSSYSSWYPTTNSQGWMPSMGNNQNWFGGNSNQNWSDSLVRNAKSMVGY